MQHANFWKQCLSSIVTTIKSVCFSAVLTLGKGYLPYPDSISRASDFGPGTANPFENNYPLEMETGRHKQEEAI